MPVIQNAKALREHAAQNGVDLRKCNLLVGELSTGIQAVCNPSEALTVAMNVLAMQVALTEADEDGIIRSAGEIKADFEATCLAMRRFVLTSGIFQRTDGTDIGPAGNA